MFSYYDSSAYSMSSNNTYSTRNFEYSDNLGLIDVSNLDTSKCTKMNNMVQVISCYQFYGLNNFDTSNVTDMNGMFIGCGDDIINLSELEDWDVSNVTDMGSMFSAFSCLGEYCTFKMDKWDTSNLTNMREMFVESSFELIDLTTWDTSNVVDMRGLIGFNYAQNLTLKMGGNIDNVVEYDIFSIWDIDKNLSKFYYNSEHDYSKIISILPSDCEVIPFNPSEEGGGKIITFYIQDTSDDTIYQFECEEGMTWEEFVNSEYNPTTGICINFKVEFDRYIYFYHVLADDDMVEVMFDYINMISVYKNELIINEYSYSMSF